MTNLGADESQQDPDPLASMSLDRVERADGRYLIYYEWRDAATVHDADQRPDPSEDGQPRV